MIIRFETTDRHTALTRLQTFMPSLNLTDTPDSAGPFLDLVVVDCIRVPDPLYHPSGAIFPSKNYEKHGGHTAVKSAMDVMLSSPKAALGATE